MPLDDRIEQALCSSEPFQQLRSLAIQLLDQGHDKTAVIERFEEVRRQLREADRETEEDVVLDVLDCLVGWCSPQMRLAATDDGPNNRVGVAQSAGANPSHSTSVTKGSRPTLYLQTDLLDAYTGENRDLADRIFNYAKGQVPRCARKEEGSFSVDAASFLFGDRIGDIGTTAAKIVIYEHGKRSKLDLVEGVYIWVRSTDPIGDEIWGSDLSDRFPNLFDLLNRDETISIAPSPNVGFSFFLFNEREHGVLEVGDLLVACARL